MFYLFFNAAGYWILAFLFLASIAKAEVFYVTSLRYRGNSNGDITQGVANAWRDAWPAKVIIPKGEYYLRGAILKGPCKAPIEIQVQGYLRAPSRQQPTHSAGHLGSISAR